MISPDFSLLLWFVLAGWAVNGILGIGLGIAHTKKSEYYDWTYVLTGTIGLIGVILVLIF